jgi:hypothetical protein
MAMEQGRHAKFGIRHPVYSKVVGFDWWEVVHLIAGFFLQDF